MCDCVWCMIFCDCERMCDKYLSANTDEGLELLNKYEEELHESTKHIVKELQSKYRLQYFEDELVVGKKVRVRKDLVDDEMYGTESFVGDMINFLGQEVTISEVLQTSNGLLYHIKEEMDWQNDDCGYFWTREMFE